MNCSPNRLNAATMILLAGASVLLASCGGSGGSGGSATPLAVSGIAATGAPMANATLQIYDKDGVAVLATPVTIQSDGSYSAEIPASAVGPFVFQVDNGSEKLISVMPDKSSSTLNVTPLTHLVAAQLSSTGNPFNLKQEIANQTSSVDATTTATAVSSIMTALKPLSDALNLGTSLNPLTANFTANGTGLDKMLDSLDVKIEPKGSASQVEITMKQAVAESESLPKIAFASNQTPPALPTVDPTKLVSSGLTPKIQELLDQLTACFNVDLSSRITSGGTTASAIQAQACKDAFIGGNPTLYTSGGMKVSKTQHFGGIFTAEASAGVKFSDPKFFYQVGATVPSGPTLGDIVFGYRWKDEYGNFQIERNVARVDTDGKLKLVGNQYAYDIGIGPYSQRRNYLMQPASTFHSVGYSLSLSCYQLNQYRAGTVSDPKIVKVNVTAPNGTKLTFVPNLTTGSCNYSYFVVAWPKNSSGADTVDGMGDPSSPTGTGFIRLQSQYETGETTSANHPRTRASGLAFVGGPSGTDLTNAQIEAIPQFATWKFEYYASKTAGSTPVATQYFKTTARSLTIDGFKKLVKLPEMTTNMTTAATCLNSTYCYTTQATGPFSVDWTSSTEAGLLPATYMARVYGRKVKTDNTTGFEDSIKFRSTARSAAIRCGQGETSVQSYCTGATPATANFGDTVSLDALDLVSRAPDGTDVSHFHTLIKLP